MPNIKSAKKRLRTAENARQRNRSVKTQVQSARRRLFDTLETDSEAARARAYRDYCSVLDKAAKKGVIKKNTAIRRKHRAAERLRTLSS